ncbi:transcription factor bHLH123-like [Lycium ferocissimum]|uniref:transcription factor bHLH123-like n=1 Tax=Lycium ferocissimum TaxID=112874 RepID=UPI002815F44C|nr:transcription factor bHLH123-like [Lycium ferocissimum]
MAEEFQIGSGNGWESSSSTTRNRFFDSGIISLSSSTTTPSTSTALSSNMASNFGNWPTNIVDIKNRSSLDSESVSEDVRRDVSSDPNLQMMGVGLNRNQTLFKGTTNHQQEASSEHQDHHWRQTIYSGNSEDSSVNDYNKGLSLHHQSLYSSNLENAAYGSSPSNMMKGVYPPYNQSNYHQFLRSSPPNQQPQLHFSNNTPLWNGTAAAMNDVRSSFFPSLPTQLPNQTADKKPKVTIEVRGANSIAKKTTSDASSKRSRNETPSPVPAFKVRKEKMGDRITALQQLVSPFGKTDTASVLSEVIEYIKFLHEQVTMLSNPYIKNGASMQHPQNFDKSNDTKQDLRSRGLCLVPVSSTFPVTNETTIDFWTPNSFGGTFR